LVVRLSTRKTISSSRFRSYRRKVVVLFEALELVLFDLRLSRRSSRNFEPSSKKMPQ